MRGNIIKVKVHALKTFTANLVFLNTTTGKEREFYTEVKCKNELAVPMHALAQYCEKYGEDFKNWHIKSCKHVVHSRGVWVDGYLMGSPDDLQMLKDYLSYQTHIHPMLEEMAEVVKLLNYGEVTVEADSRQMRIDYC